MPGLRFFYVVFFVLLAVNWSAEAQGQSQVHVTGFGSVEIQPDLAEFRIQLKAENKQRDVASASLSKGMASFEKSVVALGILPNTIKSQAYTVTPLYTVPAQGQTRELSAYRFSQSLTLELPFEGSSQNSTLFLQVFDLLTRSFVEPNVEVSFNIAFKLQDEKAAQEEALMKASEEAYQRALVLAQAMGKTLGDLVSITSGSAGSPYSPVLYRQGSGLAHLASSSESAEPSINPDPLIVREQVSLVYEIY